MFIYAFDFAGDSFEGMLKIGESSIDIERRVNQQIGFFPKGSSKIVLRVECALRDHQVHDELKRRGFENIGREWFRCTTKDILDAIMYLSGVTVEQCGESDVDFIIKNNQNFLKMQKYCEQEDIGAFIDLYKEFQKLELTKMEDFKKCKIFLNEIIDIVGPQGIQAICTQDVVQEIKAYNELFKNAEILREVIKGREKYKFHQLKSILNNLHDLRHSFGSVEKIIENLEFIREYVNDIGKDNLAFYTQIWQAHKIIDKEAESQKMTVLEYIESIRDVLRESNIPYSALCDYQSSDKLKIKVDEYKELERNKEEYEEKLQSILETIELIGINKISEIDNIYKKVQRIHKEYKYSTTQVADAGERTLTFGKYKGMLLKDVLKKDKQYIDWLYNTSMTTVDLIGSLKYLEYKETNKDPYKV